MVYRVERLRTQLAHLKLVLFPVNAMESSATADARAASCVPLRHAGRHSPSRAVLGQPARRSKCGAVPHHHQGDPLSTPRREPFDLRSRRREQAASLPEARSDAAAVDAVASAVELEDTRYGRRASGTAPCRRRAGLRRVAGWASSGRGADRSLLRATAGAGREPLVSAGRVNRSALGRREPCL